MSLLLLFRGTGAAASAPTVASATPSTGSVLGGTTVVLTGTGFAGATAVTFDGDAAASFTVINSTHISAVTAAHAAGIVDIVVTTAAGSGTGLGLFTYAIVVEEALPPYVENRDFVGAESTARRLPLYTPARSGRLASIWKGVRGS